MTFWILITAIACITAAILVLTLLRTRSQDAPAASYDLNVYREQLAGVDKDLARGVIAEADAERIRTEISRRVLAADEKTRQAGPHDSQPKRPSLLVSALAAAVLIAGGLGLYTRLGAPGYGDLPLERRLELANEIRASRPDQATAEAEFPAPQDPLLDESYADLLRQLRETVANRPDDYQGQALLAQHEANIGNFKAAYQAKTKAIALLQGDAEADDYAEQAEFMIRAAGGYVSPETEAVLREARMRDPHNGPANYYWGVMLLQLGRPDLAFGLWEETLQRGPTGAPWISAIRAQIEDVAIRAGVNYTLPAQPEPTLPGPTAEDIENASEMDAETRQEMIRGMVERLSTRLAEDGGTPTEWARLISALGVIGEPDRAARIYAEAQEAFADNQKALQLVESAAKSAGITQ